MHFAGHKSVGVLESIGAVHRPLYIDRSLRLFDLAYLPAYRSTITISKSIRILLPSLNLSLGPFTHQFSSKYATASRSLAREDCAGRVSDGALRPTSTPACTRTTPRMQKLHCPSCA
jgi:hypothetical protein